MIKTNPKRKFELPSGIETFKNLRAGQRISGWSQSAFSDRMFLAFLGAWLVPLVISAAYAMLNFGNLPLEIPLFYSRIWGEAQLAGNGYIFLPAVGSFLLGIFDFGLAISFHPKDRVFAYLLAGTSSLLAILTLVTTANIVNLMR